MLSVSVTLSGGSGYGMMLNGLVSETKNPVRVLTAMSVLMKNDVKETFRAQADPLTGNPWKPRGPLFTGGPRSRILTGETAALLNSLVSGLPVIQRDSVSIGSRLVYAAIHHRGGEVVPRTTRFLAIPLTREAKRAGYARRFPGLVFAHNDPARPFAKLPPGLAGTYCRVLISPGITESATPIAQYLLVERVRIPARPYLGLGSRFEQSAERYLANWLRQIAEGKKPL